MSVDVVDINKAGIPEFASLPKIGEKMAAKIVKYREDHQPFSTVAELAEVPGISESMVSNLAEYLVVDKVEAAAAPEVESSEPAAKEIEKETQKKKPRQPVEEFGEPGKLVNELRAASAAGDLPTVRKLLEEGADYSDDYALMWAAQSDQAAIVAELIRAGANVDNSSKERDSNALILSSQNGHGTVVRMLLDAGADVNSRDGEGWTALMSASLSGHESVVQMLLGAGADRNAKDPKGRTASYYASMAGHNTIANMISEKGK